MRCDVANRDLEDCEKIASKVKTVFQLCVLLDDTKIPLLDCSLILLALGSTPTCSIILAVSRLIRLPSCCVKLLPLRDLLCDTIFGAFYCCP